ncbi:MAG: ThuA domain-containing protein [Limisphaerales bacterium]
MAFSPCMLYLARISLFAAALIVSSFGSSYAANKKILLIAGKPSHGPGDHEFRAGALLLQKCLNKTQNILAEVHDYGWPKEDSAFDNIDAVLIYADGGGGHPAIQKNRAKLIDNLANKGIGIGCAHYGVEVPKGDPGKYMQNWIGGYYEHAFSVNPMWAPDFKTFPKHPITRGVKPFKVVDEWYFNMRFRNDNVGKITPLLIATPSDKVRNGPYVWPKGPYKHIQTNKGRSETMMWSYVRENEGRGFGFTGGHKHVNWGNDNYRKAVLNGLLWIAKAKVPTNGVESSITDKELKVNLDKK